MLLEWISSFFIIFQKAVISVIPFLILLGVLVFIHELGHFLVARWCGVTVEVFSLGFGPKLLKLKKGETIYCISAIPLGGYVKMFGDNPFETVPDSEKTRGFLYKKVPQKLAIAFGGPLMNLFFTIIAFFILAIIFGTPAFLPHLGDVLQKSSLYRQGFRSGDKILSVNEKPVQFWREVSREIKENPDQKITFRIQDKKGQIKNLYADSFLKKNEDIFEGKDEIGHVEGFNFLSKSSHIAVTHSLSKAYEYGFRSFDHITQVNETKVRYWRNLESTIKKQATALIFKIEREGKEMQIKTPYFSSLKSMGLESSEFYIHKVGPRTPAFLAGLKKGDRLISINGKALPSWKTVLNQVSSFSGEKPLRIGYKRDGKFFKTSVKPEKMMVEGRLKEGFMIGIGSGFFQAFPERVFKKFSFSESLLYSLEETKHWLNVITLGLVRLAEGRISFRTMGGPVAIGRVAHSSFREGFRAFLWIMALISLNLFFFNLLPIPLLDGGHILFFMIEGLVGRPLDPRKIFVAHQVGLLLLLSFFGLVLFNDFYNWFSAW